jgi:hypothetical protein
LEAGRIVPLDHRLHVFERFDLALKPILRISFGENVRAKNEKLQVSKYCFNNFLVPVNTRASSIFVR